MHARFLYKDEPGNQAPEFHSFINVSNGENIDTGRGYMLAWSAATDPEKYKLTYMVVVKNQSGTVLFRQDGISGTHFLLPASLFQNRTDQEIVLEIYARDNYGLQSVLSDKMTATATIGTGTALDGLLKGHVYNAHKLDWPIEKGMVVIADQTYDLYEGGFFSIPLPVGTYRVDVAVDGYDFDINYSIKILEGGITTYHIDLTPLDSDGDGVPDEWEEENGLNPLDPSDRNEDPDNDGYTNYEEYVNGTNPKNAVPLQPTILSPDDGATGLSLTPQLNTNAFQDPNHMDTHASSQWQISHDPGFSTSMVWDVHSTQHLTSVTLPEFLLNHGETYYWRVRFYDSENGASEWSETRWFSVVQEDEGDNNHNGVPDDQEIDDPDLDLDGNGIPDMDQTDMRCVRFGANKTVICLRVPQDVIAIDAMTWIDPNTISDMDNRPLALPLGLISFKLRVVPGAETKVALFLSKSVPADTEWYKHDLVDGWNPYHDYAFFNSDRTSVSLMLKDGGFGDGDGTVNGVILDPSGPGSNPVSIYAHYSGLGSDSAFGCFIQTLHE